MACIPLWRAFGGSSGGVYLVGSCLRKPDWRDVDLRAISHYLSAVTGLPIDFQLQRQTQANERYPRLEDHRRSAIGLFVHEYDHVGDEAAKAI